MKSNNQPSTVKYNPQFKQEIDIYIEECQKNKKIPTIKGFAERIGTDEQSIWAWANKKRKDEQGNLTDKLARPQFLAQVNKLKAMEDKTIRLKAVVPELSMHERKVAAKVLREYKFSLREIATWLGIGKTTVARAEKAITEEDLGHFGTVFKEAVSQKKQEGLGLTLKRMQEIVPKYQRLDHLVKAAEYFEGIRNNGNSTEIKVINILGDIRPQ